MSLTILLALFCFLVGLIYLCITKAWGTIFSHLCLAGLIALLLEFNGRALHLNL